MIIAKFQITDTFNLTNRGYVLVGIILDGTISSGNFIHLTKLEEVLKLKIIGVGMSNSISRKTSDFSLLISMNDREKVKELDLKGMEVSISKE